MDCHFLLQGNLPGPEIKPITPVSPALAGRFFTTSITWETEESYCWIQVPPRAEPVILIESVPISKLHLELELPAFADFGIAWFGAVSAIASYRCSEPTVHFSSSPDSTRSLHAPKVIHSVPYLFRPCHKRILLRYLNSEPEPICSSCRYFLPFAFLFLLFF